MMRWFKKRKTTGEKFQDFFGKLFARTTGSYTLWGELVPKGEEPVYINVYDMYPSLNKVTSKFGIGIFHAAVEVYGHEFSFHGMEPVDTTGIYEERPKLAGSLMRFRESIFMGSTTLTEREVLDIIHDMEKDYIEKDYHLFRKNCTTFTKELTLKLTNTKMPKWVNRLARLAKRTKILEMLFDREDFMP